MSVGVAVGALKRMLTRRRWYDAGLPFACTACGACCRREGEVVLAADEAEAIARRVTDGERSAASLVGDLWDRWADGSYHIDVPRGGRCPLLTDDAKCSVHDIKPLQCRTYPFWDEVVASRRSWLAESLHCEGIGAGTELVPAAVIDAARKLSRG